MIGQKLAASSCRALLSVEAECPNESEPPLLSEIGP